MQLILLRFNTLNINEIQKPYGNFKFYRMIKKITFISRLTKLTLVAVLFLLTSCKEDKYPKYSLVSIDFIPDSLKTEHRKFITETVRAASNQMTGGDYEDVDETIIQAERTANNIFSSRVIGLRKQVDNNYWNDLKLKPNELNRFEKLILDSLKNFN